MQDITGQTLDRYLITEKLGMGGMAAVFKAYQSTLDRDVAIKVLHPIVASDEKFLARFRREAKAAAALRHPHIVQVYDFGNDGDRYFMAMEYVGGSSLKQRLDDLRAQNQRMPLEDAVRIITQIADALHYAHEHGIVHRDVKPGNILIDDRGRAVLSDFGIAHMMEATRYTLSTVLGTPHYMSPEQGMDQPVDGRSDIYSLGAVFYEMLTGQVPFNADTLIAVIFKHVQEPLPPPRTVNPDIPDALDRVVVKAMAKQPDDRFASAREMAAALVAAVTPDGAPERETSPFEWASVTPLLRKEPARAPVEPVRRHNRLSTGNAFVMGGMLALLGLVGVLWLVSANTAPSTAVATATVTAADTASPAAPTANSAAGGAPAVGPALTRTATAPPPTVTFTPTPAPTATPLPAVSTATATSTAAPTPSPTRPTYRYRAPVLTEPADGSIVAGSIVTLKWQPSQELRAGEWYAVRLIYFQNGQAVYNGDDVTTSEWRLPIDFHHQADGPELRYEWYVSVERRTDAGSTEQLSPESEHFVFRWE